VRDRSIRRKNARYTFTLSNFGTMAGRYADPGRGPATVAILGAGKIRDRRPRGQRRAAGAPDIAGGLLAHLRSPAPVTGRCEAHALLADAMKGPGCR